MGKCTKKAKIAVADVSLGVRTHAKTLADACYLKLRSRRLQKLNSPRSCAKEEFAQLPEPDAQRLGIEASLGENNNLDFDVRQLQRSTTTKRTCPKTPRGSVQSALVRNSPPAHELDEFFAHEEQSIQCRFVKKYNFDIVRDLALRGRYEWVAVRP